MERTEKEKMLAGENYYAGDDELLSRWHYAKELTRRYNAADTTDKSLLDMILGELLGSRGENVWITAPIFVDYGENIHLGDNVEINMNCVFLDCNVITIGDNSGIGPNVQFYAVGHPVDPAQRLWMEKNGELATWRTNSAPITVGSNVWIGGSSIILPGVTIGDNTTIAAGSLVTKSIPSGCLAMGSPCKPVKFF